VTAPISGLTLSYNGDKVVFPYAPSKIEVEKQVKMAKTDTIKGNREDAVTELGRLSYAMPDMRLEGKSVVSDVTKLLGWLDEEAGPATAPTETNKTDNTRESPKVLELIMGTGQGLSGKVYLRSVTGSYTRFNASGDPIRAELRLKLETALIDPPKTNPTSFSPAGGRVHLTEDGDNLARIAQRTYADPNAWRAVADANGIDDPLRIKPGRNLFLPYART
jgi:hypothetical protein